MPRPAKRRGSFIPCRAIRRNRSSSRSWLRRPRRGAVNGGSWVAARRCGTEWRTIRNRTSSMWAPASRGHGRCKRAGLGDNLFSDCILAVRGATGKLLWYYQEVPGDIWDLDSIADLMLADLQINGKTRQVVMHAPKDGFFYVLDRRTGELLSADPWVTVNWSSGVNLRTGRPVINPEAYYGREAVAVTPGPGGGHVWPPWSYNPTTGLVYIPSTIGQTYDYMADPDFKTSPTDVGPNGKAQYNMAISIKRPAATGAAAAGVHSDVATTPAPSTPSPLPAIGPEGHGNILVAWDPVAQKERWRGLSAGFNSGGSLAMGNLVLSSVNTRLLVYRADDGEQLLDVTTGVVAVGAADDVHDRRQAVHRGSGRAAGIDQRIRPSSRPRTGSQGTSSALAGVCARRKSDFAGSARGESGLRSAPEISCWIEATPGASTLIRACARFARPARAPNVSRRWTRFQRLRRGRFVPRGG